MNLWPILFILLACFLTYYLSKQGILLPSKSIRAIVHIFQPGKDAEKVTLKSCTGWVNRIGRFQESRLYRFDFDGQLSKGDVDVILLDRQRQQLLRLNRQSPTGEIRLDGKGKYYLRWEYKNATGKCELRWA